MGLYISQGSVVVQLRCGGMSSNHFTTNFSQNAPVKKVWKLVNIWHRYGQNFVAYFLGHPVFMLHIFQVMMVVNSRLLVENTATNDSNTFRWIRSRLQTFIVVHK